MHSLDLGMHTIQHPFLIVVLACPLAFVLLVFWNYRGIRIEVATENLLIYYGFSNGKRILIGDTVSRDACLYVYNVRQRVFYTLFSRFWCEGWNCEGW